MKKMKIRNIIEYLFLFIMILESNSVYTRIVDYNFHIIEINYVMIGIFAFSTLISIKNIKKSTFSIFTVLFLYVLIFFILRVRDQYIKYIFEFIILLPTVYIYLSKDEERIKGMLNKISNIVVVLAVISFFFYVLGTLLNFLPHGEVTVFWGGNKLRDNYYFLHFTTQTIYINNFTIFRNTGIFTEAPMYAYILNLGLISELLLKKNDTKSLRKKLIILLVTITTLSTTGIVVSLVLIVFNYMFTTTNNKMKKVLRIVSVPVFIFIIFLIIVVLYQGKVGTDSYSMRTEDIQASISAWKKHLIIGNGFGNKTVTESFMNLSARNGITGQSSAYGRIASEGGIYLLLLYSVPFIIMCAIGIKYNMKMYTIISLISIIILINTNIPYQSITIIYLVLIINIISSLMNNKSKTINLKRSGEKDEI